ncbi:hypothetical protein HY251_05415 [bacterium]|nr:hypothetical protein [bacterium]
MSEEPAPSAAEEKPEKPANPASVLRRLALRGTIFGSSLVALLFLLMLAVFLIGGASDFRRSGFLGEAAAMAGVFFLTGFFLQAASAVELVAERWRRDLDYVAGALAVGAAFAMIVVIVLQASYTEAFLRSFDPSKAYDAAWNAYERLRRSKEELTLVATFAIPFGPVTFTRLRKKAVGIQAGVAAGVTLLLVVPLLLLALSSPYMREDVKVQSGLAVCEALALPVVFRVADSTEERVARWLARREQA